MAKGLGRPKGGRKLIIGHSSNPYDNPAADLVEEICDSCKLKKKKNCIKTGFKDVDKCSSVQRYFRRWTVEDWTRFRRIRGIKSERVLAHKVVRKPRTRRRKK